MTVSTTTRRGPRDLVGRAPLALALRRVHAHDGLVARRALAVVSPHGPLRGHEVVERRAVLLAAPPEHGRERLGADVLVGDVVVEHFLLLATATTGREWARARFRAVLGTALTDWLQIAGTSPKTSTAVLLNHHASTASLCRVK